MEQAEKISKSLDKMLTNNFIDRGITLKYLRVLQSMEMNLDILTKTGIGIIINKVRKEAEDADITSIGKQLIKQWKKLVPEKPEPVITITGVKHSLDMPNGISNDDTDSVETKRFCGGDEHDSRAGSQNRIRENQSLGLFPDKNFDTTDDVRLTARKMIRNALESKPAPSGAFEAEFLAIRIESAIFNTFKCADSKYKQRVRTRVMNLKDFKNPNLRDNVLLGNIKPDRLASMTSEEMASSDMKELREKYNKETIDDHQMAVSGGTESDILKCGKCRQSKCSYNQVQTRSADEPMTTFVYCNNCGHRWKFC